MRIQCYYYFMSKEVNDRRENCSWRWKSYNYDYFMLALRHNWCQPTMFNGRSDTNEQTIKITIREKSKDEEKTAEKNNKILAEEPSAL